MAIWTPPGVDNKIVVSSGKIVDCPDCPCDEEEEEPEQVDCQHSINGKAWKNYAIEFDNLHNNSCGDCADYDNKQIVVGNVNPVCFPAPPAGGDDSQCQWRLTGLTNPDTSVDCPFRGPYQSDVGWPWPCHVSTGYGRVDFQVFNDSDLRVFRVRFFGRWANGR